MAIKHQISTSLRIAATLMAFSAGICFFSYVSVDPDLWGHITFGRDLWATGTIPGTDPYSFTALGKTWTNHEWLTELVFYLVYRYFGDAGLLLGKLAIGMVVVGLLCKLSTLREQNPIVSGGILVLAIKIISPGFMIRPQIFSFFFFILFVSAIHLFFDGVKNRLAILPLLMAAWVNLHGGFLLGWILFGAVTGWSTLRHIFFAKQKNLRWLWLWFLITSAAVLANPYGYKLLVFLYDTLSIPRQISEWAPVSLWDLSHPYLKLMAFLFCFAFFVKPTRHSGWEIVAIIITLVAAFRHERHAPFFAMIATPFLVRQGSEFVAWLRKRIPNLTLSATGQHLVALLFFFIASYQVYCGGRQYILSRFRIIVDPSTYPVAALRFLDTNGLKGNLLVPFDWGEHAIWKLYPKCLVSVDGRFRTVYPENVIEDHFVAEGDDHRWMTLIHKYEADILLARQIPFFQNLIKLEGPWVYIYSDPTSIIFLKRNDKNKEALKFFHRGTLTYPTEPPTPYFPG